MAQKQRIAVLGGGIAALSSVYGLTQDPAWSDTYDITVYQMGWRLGGKGATGRQPQYGNRILEHGFHAWFGFYENAFSMLRQVYRELDRSPDAPLSTWEQAMLPHSRVILHQRFNGEAHPWVLDLPTNDMTPGDGLPLPGPLAYISEAIQVVIQVCEGLFGAELKPAPDPVEPVAPHGVKAMLERLEEDALAEIREWVDPIAIFAHIQDIVRALGELDPPSDDSDGHPVLCAMLRFGRSAIWSLLKDKIDTDLMAYRAWLASDFIITNLIGVLQDQLIRRGFNVINDQNYDTWLKSHGISKRTAKSVLVQAFYDSCFAFFPTLEGERHQRHHAEAKREGEPHHKHGAKHKHEIEAGTALRGALRQLLIFKGASLYQFAQGTGDTVFAPLYTVLKRRGVKFRFFHRVDELEAAQQPDGSHAIERVHLTEQAHLTVDTYSPLTEIDGLPCWPAHPLYDQLKDGHAIQAARINFESPWFNAKHGENTFGAPKVLTRGEDFDAVVLGISIAALPQLTPTLAAASPSWRAMLDNVKTVRTQAFQLWIKSSPEELGFPYGNALLSCDGEPMDTIANMSFLINADHWPEGHRPKTLLYFCGAMGAMDREELPPPGASEYPQHQFHDAVLALKYWLEGPRQRLRGLFPGLFDETGAFRYEELVDPHNREGYERLYAQMVRANVDPSERYVLSLTGSSAYRLKSDGTDFANLYLAGDWTDNGINAGCMEAAVISGLQASRGICGSPAVIMGEKDSLTGL